VTDMSQAAHVGLRIHRLRTALGMSQKELAAPKYTTAFVSSVESGRQMPSRDALEHLAGRLGISVGELQTGRAADVEVRLDLALAVADAAAGMDPAMAITKYQQVAADSAATSSHRAHCDIGIGHAWLRAADAADNEDTCRAALTAAAAHFTAAGKLLSGEVPHLRSEAIVGSAVCLRKQGDPRYAAYLLTEIRDELLRTGYPDPSALLTLHVQLAVCHSDLGDDDEAASSASAALTLAGLSDPGAVADLHVEVARTLLAANRLGEAATALVQARQVRKEAALRPKLGWCHRARGRDRAKEGDLVGAVADLVAAHQFFTAAGHVDEAVDTGIELAETYQALGRSAQSEAVLDALPEGLTSARAARALRVRGLLAADADDPESAERHFRAAVDGYRHVGPRRELAVAVGELADLLARQDRLDEAAEVMRDGLAQIQTLTGRGGRAPVVPGSAASGV
jgi:transcriptional regulator with XRE-family HTH domain